MIEAPDTSGIDWKETVVAAVCMTVVLLFILSWIKGCAHDRDVVAQCMDHKGNWQEETKTCVGRSS